MGSEKEDIILLFSKQWDNGSKKPPKVGNLPE